MSLDAPTVTQMEGNSIDQQIAIHFPWSQLLSVGTASALTVVSCYVVYIDVGIDSSLSAFCLWATFLCLVEWALILTTTCAHFCTRMAREAHHDSSLSHSRLSNQLDSPLLENQGVSLREMEEGEGARRARRRPVALGTLRVLYVSQGVSVTLVATTLIVYAAFWDVLRADCSLDHSTKLKVTFGLTLTANFIAQAYSMYSNVLLRTRNSKNRARNFLLTANVFLVVIASSMVATNQLQQHYDGNTLVPQTHHHVSPWPFRAMFALGILELVIGAYGLIVTLVTFLGKLGDKYLASATLPVPYLILVYVGQFVGILLAALSGILAISYRHTGVDSLTVAMMRCNCLAAILMCVASFLAQSAYSLLTNPRLISGLEVEEVDLDDAEVIERCKREKWVEAINQTTGDSHVGAWGGEDALALMRMYQRAFNKRGAVPDVDGVCLRIYSSTTKIQNPIFVNPDSKNQDCKHETKTSRSEEETIALVFITVVKKFDLTDYVHGCLGRCLKQLFGARGLIPILSMRFGLVGFQWPFHSGVFLVHRRPGASSGGVIMTRVLRAVVEWNDAKGKCATLLVPSLETQTEHKSFSYSHFLTLSLTPTTICDLRPHAGRTYKEFMKKALKKGDRRDHEGYFRKRDGLIHIDEKFQSGLGENYDLVLFRLWTNIASFRTGRGEAQTLIQASPEFFRSISEDLPSSSRSLFALTIPNPSNTTTANTYGEDAKVPNSHLVESHVTTRMCLPLLREDKGVVCNRGLDLAVGSAILFSFRRGNAKGGTLTSDIQGLDHRRARPRKGYFVMLARAVRYALENGYDFVDFGPTTVKPKIDAGCRLVKCYAGYHTRSLLMRSMLKSSSAKFTSSQQDDSVEAKGDLEDVKQAAISRDAAFREAELRKKKMFMLYCEEDFQEWEEELRVKYGVTERHHPRPTPEDKTSNANPNVDEKSQGRNKKKRNKNTGNKPSANQAPFKKGIKKRKKRSRKGCSGVSGFEAGKKVTVDGKEGLIVKSWVHNQSGVGWCRIKFANGEANFETVP
ncbi:hypothetical protein AAMO2058_000111000 [Amorphochlora amoebiformis]